MIKFIYTIFVGVLVATFVGVGIQAFYPQPKPPQLTSRFPVPPDVYTTPNSTQAAQLKDQQSQFVKEQQDFQAQTQEYNKNVSIITVIAAIILLAISLTIFKSVALIADGLILGGCLTLIYSIFRGFNSGDDKFRFVVVTIGLVIALVLGFIKFIKPSSR